MAVGVADAERLGAQRAARALDNPCDDLRRNAERLPRRIDDTQAPNKK